MKIKKPINKGVAKVPVVMQLEVLECGAACLAMILAYYDKWIPIEKVREDCGVSRNGSNAKNILVASRNYGLDASAYRYTTESLKSKGSFPCIIFWNFNHFVVLDGFKNGKAYINDPAKGSYNLPIKSFNESYSGICLFFNPTEKFVPSGRQKSIFEFMRKRLKGSKEALFFLILAGTITPILNFIRPAFSRVFLDHLLPGYNDTWVTPFVLFLILFSIIEITMSCIQSIYALRIDGKMSAIGNSTYMWKLFKMPIKFFSQRMAGDIKDRQASNAAISNVLMNTVAPILFSAIMTIFYLVVMIRYSIILTIIGLTSLIITTFVSRYISNERINITRVSMRDSAKLSSATVAGIEMVETIKSSGAESGFFKRWSGYQANVNANHVKFLEMNQYLSLIPQFISTFANNIVLFLGVWLAMQGDFTVGMIMAFQGFLSSFMSPATQLITTSQILQEVRTQMERIEDVMEYPEEKIFSDEELNSDIKKLSGLVELKNVTFGYSPLDEPFIKDFNMKTYPGKSVAIVGSSGCGKSTMSKLISGLYKQWSGEILFDGKPLDKIQKNIFRSSVAVVDQDIILFQGTISENISMWDSTIEDYEIKLAAKDANLHDDIMKRKNGYDDIVLWQGKNLSGGQRQRMEIARTLAQEPTILILDEATSALDAKTEYEVVESIKKRGITTIVIAHRLSTIRSCDEIIVLDHGVIKDRGTHDELMKKCDIYKNLISAE